jgi:pimeloyl-ACP methyl ester carboxylesterase
VRRCLGERVALVGHSMGGGAAVLYAGTEPEHVWAFVSIEGLGMPDTDPATVPDRVVNWLHDLRRHERRPRMSVSYDAAMERLRYRFPTFSEETAHLLIEHGTRPVNGRLFWKFDPLHQTRAPQPIYVAEARAFWRRVACPTLYVEGSESRLRLSEPDLADRLATLRAERVSLAGAGHHPQLEQPAALTQVLLAFLGRARGAT